MAKKKAKKHAPRLTDKHRAFVVQQLACYTGPQETANLLFAEYGIRMDRGSIEHYDPNKCHTNKLAPRWRELFAVTREAFHQDVVAKVPEANVSVRIKKLAKAAAAFEKQKNYMGMARMLEMIAKETGGAYTNRRELTGKDGGPIKYAEVSDMTDEQILDELRSYGIDPAQMHAPNTTKQ